MINGQKSAMKNSSGSVDLQTLIDEAKYSQSTCHAPSLAAASMSSATINLDENNGDFSDDFAPRRDNRELTPRKVHKNDENARYVLESGQRAGLWSK